MGKPTWLNFLVRVGGVGAAFAGGILMAREFFPGSETFVVAGISAAVLGVLAVCEIRAKARLKARRRDRAAKRV